MFLTIPTQNAVLIKSFALFEIKRLKIVSIMNIFYWNISKTAKILKMVSDTTQLPKVQQTPLQTSINIQALHKLLSKNVKKARYSKEQRITNRVFYYRTYIFIV